MRFTGVEAINELFRFEAVISARREAVEAVASPDHLHHELPKADVSFSLGGEGMDDGPEAALASVSASARYGMIAAAHHEGFASSGHHDHVRLRLEIVPRMWLLTQRTNSRIFQDKYLHEIVSTVLHENGVRHAWALENEYPRRLYCTQYQETDYAFVTRLLAEEGVLFYFTHPGAFDGGPAAKVKADKSDFDKGLKVAKEVVDIVKMRAGHAGSATGQLGGESGEVGTGIATFGESVAGMAGDAVKALMGVDETPIIVPGRGESGPEGGGDVMWFVDVGGVYPECKNAHGELVSTSMHHAGGLVARHSETLSSLRHTYRSVPKLMEVRDYDFRKPLLLLKENAHDGHHAPEEEEEGGHGHGDGPPPAGHPMERYEHHGEYETPDVDRSTADVRLEQHRRRVSVYEGQGHTPYLRAGHFFEVADEEHGNSLVVTRIRHEFHTQAPSGLSGATGPEREALARACAHAIHQVARNPDLGEQQIRDAIHGVLSAPPEGGIVYQNFFEGVVHTKAFRPSRPERKICNVTESATVMGPKGQDIYTDRFGRVKVQFHWDRQGQFDAKSSVWMRVLQPWAGAGYGFQFFPRVGMEVLVTFLGGDPDRPVVLGSLYNGTHATPEPLPERMTRSGIRTQSTPKGGGFNELSFDDKKGTERVYLHAERDFDAEINHSHSMKVRHAHTLSVGARHQVGVEGEQLLNVGGLHATTIGADQASCVGGSRRDRVVGNASHRVEGNRVEEIGGSVLRKVDGDDMAIATGSRDVAVFGDSSFHVEKDLAGYAGNRAYIKGKHCTAVGTEIVTLRVGTSFIQVKDGDIILEADRLWLNGREVALVRGRQGRARDRARRRGARGRVRRRDPGQPDRSHQPAR